MLLQNDLRENFTEKGLVRMIAVLILNRKRRRDLAQTNVQISLLYTDDDWLNEYVHNICAV